jgi:hypothetical protein
MRKRRLLFFCLGAGLVLTAVVWALSREGDREPTYEGRTLSDWANRSPEKWDEGSNAIRHMGTNTLPTILKWLRSGPAPWKAKMLRRLSVVPDWIKPDSLVSWLTDEQAQTRVMRAYQVLGNLQNDAAPIGPELLRLSYDKSIAVPTRALVALGSMGITGLPYLLRAFRDPNHPHRVEAVGQIAFVLENNPAATNAFQAIIECAADKDAGVRNQASVALASWASEQPAGAEIDEFKRSVGSTNKVFLRTIRHFERFLIDHKTNGSPVP